MNKNILIGIAALGIAAVALLPKKNAESDVSLSGGGFGNPMPQGAGSTDYGMATAGGQLGAPNLNVVFEAPKSDMPQDFFSMGKADKAASGTISTVPVNYADGYSASIGRGIQKSGVGGFTGSQSYQLPNGKTTVGGYSAIAPTVKKDITPKSTGGSQQLSPVLLAAFGR